MSADATADASYMKTESRHYLNLALQCYNNLQTCISCDVSSSVSSSACLLCSALSSSALSSSAPSSASASAPSLRPLLCPLLRPLLGLTYPVTLGRDPYRILTAGSAAPGASNKGWD